MEERLTVSDVLDGDDFGSPLGKRVILRERKYIIAIYPELLEDL